MVSVSFRLDRVALQYDAITGNVHSFPSYIRVQQDTQVSKAIDMISML
jgi:hypothetical protein